MLHFTRHRDHVKGDTLYYFDRHMVAYRPGEVYEVIRHNGLIYYILEVQTGAPLHESFLHMVSQMNVVSEDERYECPSIDV